MAQLSRNLTRKKDTALEHFRNGRLQEARELFEWVVKKEPGDWQTWNMLGAIYGMLGDHGRCEACCRTVLKIQPASFSTYNNLGNALKHQGKAVEAEAAYNRALSIQPQYAEAYSNLGELLRERGDVERAEEFLRKALSIKPDHAGAYNNLGSLHLNRGELQAAVECYGKSLQLRPGQPETLYNLGCAFMSLGRYEQAAEYFRRYLAIQPTHVEAWMSLCMVLSHLKRFDEAVASGQKAVALGANNADAYFVLGSTYQSMGNDVEAKNAYQKALQAQPDHASAAYFNSMLEGRIPDHAPHEYVRELFDSYAHKFDNDLTRNLDYRTPEHISRLLRQYADTSGGKIRIVDLGCGTGLVGPLVRDMASMLVGVDLSPKMIAMARQKAVYDTLVVSDVTDLLRESHASCDAVIAADVFVYIGNLEEVFSASRKALVAGGCFIFSTESEEGRGEYLLRESGRYAHTNAYIHRLAADHGFDMLHSESLVLRKEGGSLITGTLFVLRARD
jgi:predicted TPR repeat methyltransferase